MIGRKKVRRFWKHMFVIFISFNSFPYSHALYSDRDFFFVGTYLGIYFFLIIIFTFFTIILKTFFYY